VGYSSVANIMALSSLVQSLLPPKIVKSRKNLIHLTLQQFKVIQGHRSWCQWKAHMWLPISH